MSRCKLFIENFMAYGLIGVLNKAVPLLMLPIIARLLPDTADFGRFDMYSMIINFGSSLAILGMYDAMFREFFEKEDPIYQRKVTSTACRIVLLASVAVMMTLILFHESFSELFLGKGGDSFIILTAAAGVWISANSSIISAPTRMKNQRSIYIVSGLTQSIAYYGFAILFIQLGLGYKSLIYSNLIALVGLSAFFWYLNKDCFSLRTFDRKIARELCRIGLPLLPTFLIYWALSSMDKIMIANMLDMHEVGIYSIGLKVASISQLIYMAFAGGWQYFAFSTMKDQDQVELTSKVFEYLGIISYVIFLCVFPFIDMIFVFFFSGDYLNGKIVFPYLFFAPLLLMLYQTASNQFIVIRKTYYGLICLLAGIAMNFIFNLIWIKEYGIKGAAMATLIGYAIIVICVSVIAVKMNLLKIRKKFIIVSFVVILALVYLFKYEHLFFYYIAIMDIIIAFFYRKEIIMICKNVSNIVNKK